MKTQQQLPWTILFVILTVWAIVFAWPISKWQQGAHSDLQSAQHSEELAFATMQMDSKIIEQERAVDARLHKLPSLMTERLNELHDIDAIFRQNHVKEEERNIKADGTIHLVWDAAQNDSIKTLYDFRSLPVPIMAATTKLSGAKVGITTDLTGQAIGAAPQATALPVDTPTPSTTTLTDATAAEQVHP